MLLSGPLGELDLGATVGGSVCVRARVRASVNPGFVQAISCSFCEGLQNHLV